MTLILIAFLAAPSGCWTSAPVNTRGIDYRTELARGVVLPASLAIDDKALRTWMSVDEVEQQLGAATSTGDSEQRTIDGQCAFLRTYLDAHTSALVLNTLTMVSQRRLAGLFGTSSWEIGHAGKLTAYWRSLGDGGKREVYLFELVPTPVEATSVITTDDGTLRRNGPPVMLWETRTNRVSITH